MPQTGVDGWPVRTGTLGTGDERSKTVFAGNLADMPVAGLLQSLELNRATARIHVRAQTCAGIVRGELAMHQGSPLFARFGASESEDAVYRMVALAEGTFRVDFEPVPIELGNITTSLTGLLMESARQQDELARLRESLPPWDARLRRAAKAPPLRAAEHELALRCDGRRTIGELIETSPSPLTAASTLQALVDRGALVVARPPRVVVNLPERSAEARARPVEDERPREPTRPRRSLARRAGLQTAGALLGLGLLASAVAFVVPTSEGTAAVKVPEAAPVVIASPAPFCRPDAALVGSEVCVDRAPVTVAAFGRCVAAGACTPALGPVSRAALRAGRNAGLDTQCHAKVEGRENRPVNCITQAQAKAYCGWLGRRLIDEAELAKAAALVQASSNVDELTASRANAAAEPHFAVGFRCVSDPRLSG